MIYPEKIEKDDLIGITATSMGCISKFDIKKLELAKLKLEELGFSSLETPNVKSNKKFVSSAGIKRAKEFLSLWKRNDIKLIMQLRGGEFLMEMIPYLDRNLLEKCSPKWVTGYSDSSLLNFYLTTNFNIATLTGPNIREYAMKPFATFLNYQLELLQNDIVLQNSFDFYEDDPLKESLEYHFTKPVCYKSLYNDEKIIIKGRLIGGCLEAISSIIGTKYDVTEEFCKSFPEGMLWYLDIYDANPLTLTRQLWQMREANWFSNTNGVIIGRTKAIKEVLDYTYLDSLHKTFDSLNIPVIYDIDIGHVMPSFSIINGSVGTFIYENGKGSLKQEKI